MMDEGETRAPGPAAPHERFETWVRLGMSRRWRWHAAEGAGLILLGAVSLLAAAAGGSPVSGATLIAAGAMTLVTVWCSEQCSSSSLSAFLALVALAAGVHLLYQPADAVLGLTYAACFALRGTASMLIAAAHRRQRLNQWEWFAVSGVASLILAALILSGLPGPYVWMLGLLLGVALIFDGSAGLAVVLSSDRLSATAPSAEKAKSPALAAGRVYEDSIRA